MRRERRERRALRWMRKFPVTTLIWSQYTLFVLWPAVRTGRGIAREAFVPLGIGFIVPLLVELFFAPVGVSRGSRPRSLPQRGVLFVTLFGIMALFLTAQLGQGLYQTQVQGGSASPLAAMLTPFSAWAFVGPIWLLYGASTNQWDNRWALRWVWLAAAAIAVHAISIARIAPAASYFVLVAFMAPILGVLRLRAVAVMAIAAIMVWPLAYSVRNTNRVQQGALAAEIGRHDPENRLEMNRNLDLLAQFEDVPVSAGQPSVVAVARYGIVPRFVDSDRDELATATRLNTALGGAPTSAASLTMLGGVYALSGELGLVLYLIIVSLGIAFTIRLRHPLASAALGIMVVQMLWIESTYPDGMAAAIQAMISTAAAWITLGAFRARSPTWLPRQ